MSKGKPNPNWKDHVLAWEESGKSAAAWSKENKIPYTTFLGWRNRFNKSKNKKTVIIPKATFIELKDRKPPASGVSIDYQGIKIHLEPEFNAFVLQQCLVCLRGALC